MEGRRFWPADRPPTEAEAIETCCAQCGLLWSVHADLAGGRLACECGDWVYVPAPVRPMSLPLHKALSDQALIDGTGPQPLTTEQKVEAYFEPLEEFKVSQQESTKGIFQLVLVMACFLVPSITVAAFMNDELGAALQPVLGLISGALILLIGAATGGVAFVALRKASPARFAEGALVALGVFGVAYLLFHGMESSTDGETHPLSELLDYLGPSLSIFTIALCPALFEELAFRGLVQARAQRVLGKHQGLLVTAVAFTLAHGISLASPLHLALGLHLSWLRNRSGSLLPGMVEHFVYNALVITFLY